MIALLPANHNDYLSESDEILTSEHGRHKKKNTFQFRGRNGYAQVTLASSGDDDLEAHVTVHVIDR